MLSENRIAKRKRTCSKFFLSNFALPGCKSSWCAANPKADGKSRSKYRSLFNLQSYPRMFLVDKDKTILYRHYGGVTEAELEKVLEKIGIK